MKLVRLAFACKIILGASLLWGQTAYHPDIPRVWDDDALADWATPLAGLNGRPTHISAEQYYEMPVDNLKTYPVYVPGREPKGYWEMLQHVGPRPMIEPEKLRSEADWIEAGRVVFEQADDIQLRTYDPKLIESVRRGEGLSTDADVAVGARWIPTKQGVALSILNCSSCHLLAFPGGTRIPGAPTPAVPPPPHTTFGSPPALPDPY